MRRVFKPFANNNTNHQHEDQGRNEPSAAPKGSSLLIILLNPKQKQRLVKLMLTICLFMAAIYVIFQRVAEAGVIHRTPIDKSALNQTSVVTNPPSYHLQPLEENSKCKKFRGILHIQHGDREGAAGSIFFLFILNQLIYADKYQLLPWIHLNNISRFVYDNKIHGGSNNIIQIDSTNTASRPRQFQVLRGAHVSWSEYFDHVVNKSFPYPGPPQNLDRARLQLKNISVIGNGVWESYFEQPLQRDFPMPLLDCPQLPVLSMSFDQVIPALHAFCPWSVRAWKYGGTPPSLQPKNNVTTWQWLEPQRKRAHEIVSKYYHFQPVMLQRVHEVWENATRTIDSSATSQSIDDNSCLGMHVRHSDKANLRKRIPTDRFKSFVEAYRNAGGTCVYLATDSHKVVSRIRQNWPSAISRMIATPSSVMRSFNKTAVFVLGQNDHHRTNTEVLVDIVALSKCRFLLHGYSAVSEASIYLNLQLHYQSVNLEDRNHVTAAEFERMVRRVLQKPQEQNQVTTQ